MKNVIQSLLSKEERESINAKILDLETLLSNKLSVLSTKERSQYGSINEQSKLLVNKVRDYRQSSPSMSSPDVDWDEFELDYQSRVFLESNIAKLNTIVRQMENTKILHDYDNYHDSLTDYSFAQYKKGAEEAGFDDKVTELKQFFAKNTPKQDKNK